MITVFLKNIDKNIKQIMNSDKNFKYKNHNINNFLYHLNKKLINNNVILEVNFYEKKYKKINNDENNNNNKINYINQISKFNFTSFTKKMENQTQKRFYLDLKNLQIFEVEKSNNTNSNLNTNEKNLVEITYDNHKISEEQIQKIISSKKFIDYIKNLDTDILLIKSLKILNVYMFGKNVGFIGLELDCSLKSHLDKKLPGYVFIRGKSVGILVLINRKYMVLTKQFRIPVGKMMYEIPAGMLDESGDFIGVAAKELEEEIGVKIKKDELKYLTSIFPSAGGCDEEIVIYLNELNLQEEEIEIMKTKTFGEENSDEVITLKIEDFNYENVMKTKDAKLIAAAFAAVNEKGVSFFSNSSSTSTSKF